MGNVEADLGSCGESEVLPIVLSFLPRVLNDVVLCMLSWLGLSPV